MTRVDPVQGGVGETEREMEQEMEQENNNDMEQDMEQDMDGDFHFQGIWNSFPCLEAVPLVCLTESYLPFSEK